MSYNPEIVQKKFEDKVERLKIKTFEERKRIREMLIQGYKVSQIAEEFDISISTIYREIQLGIEPVDKKLSYNPEIAQKKFEDKVESLKKLRKKPKKAKNAAEELNNDLRMGTLLFKEILEKVDISRNTILKNIKNGMYPDISTKFKFYSKKQKR